MEMKEVDFKLVWDGTCCICGNTNMEVRDHQDNTNDEWTREYGCTKCGGVYKIQAEMVPFDGELIGTYSHLGIRNLDEPR